MIETGYILKLLVYIHVFFTEFTVAIKNFTNFWFRVLSLSDRGKPILLPPNSLQIRE